MRADRGDRESLRTVLRWLWLLVVGLYPMRAVAQDAGAPEREPWHLRGTVALATMLTTDQRGVLGYDRLSFVGDLQLGYSLTSWLDLRAGFAAGAFPAKNRVGALLQPQLGAAVAWPGWLLRPWLQLDIGPGFTGDVVRTAFRVAVGLDVPVAQSVSIAPVVGYWHLFQHDGPKFTTDAGFLWFGIAVGIQPVRPHEVVERREETVVNVKERWVEREREVAPEIEPEPLPERPHEPVQPSPELLSMIESTLPTQQRELLAPILFAYDSDQITPQGIAMLHEVAKELKRRPQLKRLEIRGYADVRGSAEYNLALSERRSHAVQAWLVEHGVERERLVIAAQGAADFVEHGEDEPAHEQNRRVVFRVLEAEEQP
jgi:outer membrane protein OmpA-like peptidoglycan-associated protein